MYMKTFIYPISRIRYLILSVKGQNNRLIKHHYALRNVTYKQSAPSLSKTALSIFNWRAIAKGDNNVKVSNTVDCTYNYI